MTLGVVIPYRGTDEWRVAAVDRVERHLHNVFGDRHYVLLRADDGKDPFSRGASIMRGAKDIPGADVFLACDADLLVPAPQLRDAVKLAEEADGLVIAFDRYLYLTPQQSKTLTTSLQFTLPASPRAKWFMPGSLGGAGAFSRHTLELTGGFPAIFRGWGMEDVAFELLADEFAGRTRRVDGDALHLYHPVDPTNDPNSPGYQRNVDALGRLIDARQRGRGALLEAVAAAWLEALA